MIVRLTSNLADLMTGNNYQTDEIPDEQCTTDQRDAFNSVTSHDIREQTKLSGDFADSLLPGTSELRY